MNAKNKAYMITALIALGVIIADKQLGLSTRIAQKIHGGAANGVAAHGGAA